MPASPPVDALVIGCGLIGTSIGLALRAAGQEVLLDDADPQTTERAAWRGAGEVWDGSRSARLVVVATPPRAVADRLRRAQDLNLAETYTHVASVQSQVQSEVEALNCDQSSIVGGHPLAGRESSGPDAALGELFAGRPWAVCPLRGSSERAIAAVERLAEACGAIPLRVDPETHDAAVARLSHLPHVVSAALAGRLERHDVPGVAGQVEPEGVARQLSGPGLADTTRLAAGDPALWTEILLANAGHVAAEVRALADDLHELAAALASARVAHGASRAAGAGEAGEAVRQFLERGRRGRGAVPVKRGAVSDAFAEVSVELDDRPGRLAALLAEVGSVGVNVEDVRVEHVPGRPTGLITLAVAAAAAPGLVGQLNARGWLTRPLPSSP